MKTSCEMYSENNIFNLKLIILQTKLLIHDSVLKDKEARVIKKSLTTSTEVCQKYLIVLNYTT